MLQKPLLNTLTMSLIASTLSLGASNANAISLAAQRDDRVIFDVSDDCNDIVVIAATDELPSITGAENPATERAAKDAAKEATKDAQRAINDAGRAAQDAIRAAGDAARAAIESVDVNEIRETVRRAMDETRRGNVVINIASETPQRGNPYSARETREFRQTLGDGTVISRQSTRLLARDGEGRTRQELRQPDGTARIFINDPVAKRAIILDPQRKLACRAEFDREEIFDCFSQMRGDWKPLGFSFNASSKGGIAMMTASDDVSIHVSPNAKVIDLTQSEAGSSWAKTWRMPVPPAPPLPPSSALPSSAPPPLPPLAPNAALSKDGSLKRERITQTYEGLRVEVDRSVETIAAGVIGNSRPIESINERYYSPDLKMNLYSRRSDPRSGESIYRVIDIKRSEPERALFRVPSGFTETVGKSR
jgi:hypothetical protein